MMMDLYDNYNIEESHEEDVYNNELIDDNLADSHNVSFEGGGVADFYDSQISSAESLRDYHLNEITKTNDAQTMEFHANHAHNYGQNVKYWEDCKAQADIDHKMRENELEHLSKIYEIASRHINDK